MAEALAVVAVIASVAQLADLGCKLSVKLFAFSQSAATADESIRGISSDVSLTSTVLQELSLIIKADDTRIVSSAAVEATKQTVAECLKIFEQLDEALEKAIGNGGGNSKGKGKRGMSMFEKLKFPFKQPKLDLLRSNLDRLKASLSLMLQVLSYARDVSNRKIAETSLAYQQHMIEALARSQGLAEKRYHSLKLALECQGHPPSFNTFVSASVDPSSSRGIDRLLMEPDAITAKIGCENIEPPTSSKTLVHELLLCFDLLNEVIFHHINEKRSTDPITSDYDELDKATKSIKKQELSSLGYDPASNFPQAGRNLTRRLEKLSTPSSYVPPTYKHRSIRSLSFKSPVSTSNGIHPVAQDHEVESLLSSENDHTMACSPRVISNGIQHGAQHPELEFKLSPKDEFLVERRKLHLEIRRAGNKRFPEDFVNPTKALPAKITNENVVGWLVYREAEFSVSSPQSIAWGSMKSAGAMARKGVSTFGSEMYVAVRAGSSWLVGDKHDDRNSSNESMPVTVNETCVLQPIDPMDDNDDDENDAHITRDVVEDLLAKWTNLPRRKTSPDSRNRTKNDLGFHSRRFSVPTLNHF